MTTAIELARFTVEPGAEDALVDTSTASGAAGDGCSARPAAVLAVAATGSIVVDVPITHLLQPVGSDGAPGPVSEHELDPQVGAVFTRVDIWTPDDHSFACDYLRRPEDKPVCDRIDPAAAAELPG